MNILTEELVVFIVSCRCQGKTLMEISEIVNVDYDLLMDWYRRGENESEGVYRLLYDGLKFSLKYFSRYHFNRFEHSDSPFFHIHLLSVTEPDRFNIYHLRKEYLKDKSEEVNIDYELLEELMKEFEENNMGKKKRN